MAVLSSDAMELRPNSLVVGSAELGDGEKYTLVLCRPKANSVLAWDVRELNAASTAEPTLVPGDTIEVTEKVTKLLDVLAQSVKVAKLSVCVPTLVANPSIEIATGGVMEATRASTHEGPTPKKPRTEQPLATS